MIRAARTTLGTCVLTVLLVVGLTTPTALGSPAAQTASQTASQTAAKTAAHTAAQRGATEERWAPPVGVAFNNPFDTKDPRNLQRLIMRATRATPAGEYIQISTWNFNFRTVAQKLVAAHERGVHVQVVVSGQVDSANWAWLERQLNRDTEDESFAVQCRGGCRSRTKIMHSKFYLFSKVNDTPKVSLFGSMNLTITAGDYQWNDLVTSHDGALFDYFSRVFGEYARDRAVDQPYEQVNVDDKYRVTLYPVGDRNPQLAELRKVRCRGTTGGTGNAAHRTVLRLSVAGWFDTYGQKIANRVRDLWDQGCDIKILTTLAGRGINQTLKNPRGRGPVPIKKLTVDRNNDGIPEKYSHMKAMSISGVYDGDSSASVVFTGSPNWSSRAARSEEIWVRILDVKGMVSKYQRWINRWYSSGVAHAKLSTRADLKAAVARKVAGNGLTAKGQQQAYHDLLSGFELD